jgi:hypothetical protein
VEHPLVPARQLFDSSLADIRNFYAVSGSEFEIQAEIAGLIRKLT